VTAHLALDLVDEREAEEILNDWEEHLEEGS
jgi:hydrogenase maturation factor